MDGVIVDTEPLHRKAYFKMFDEMNLPVSEALYTSFTGQSTLEICQTLVSNFSLTQTPQSLVNADILNTYLNTTTPSNYSPRCWS